MKKYKVDEDAVMAGGGDGGVVSGGEIASPSTGSNDIVSGSGIKTNDILGKYEKGEGVMGKGDFHCPDKLFNVKSRAIDGGKWKRKKDKPQVKIVHISEDEVDETLNDDILSKIVTLSEEDICMFLIDNYNIENKNLEISAIAYVKKPYNFFIIKFKYKYLEKFVIVNFENDNFIKNAEYPDLLTVDDIKNNSNISSHSDIQIVW